MGRSYSTIRCLVDKVRIKVDQDAKPKTSTTGRANFYYANLDV